MSPSSVMVARGVSCRSLADLLGDLQDVLVVDVRSFLQFNKGHIRNAVNVPCSPLMLRRLQNGKGLAEYVTTDVRERLVMARMVVLYDGKTVDIASVAPRCPLATIATALGTDDVELFFLSGGFDNFSDEFPSLCESSPSETNSMRRLQVSIGSPLSAPITPFRHTLSLGSVRQHCAPPAGLSLKLCVSDSGLGDDSMPSEILPHVLLGSMQHSCDVSVLRAERVTAVLNVSTSCPNCFEPEFQYKRIPVEDSLNATLSPWLEETARFIDSVALTGGRVLVHCVGGVSRSATVCIAYLMHSRNMSLQEAYDFVKLRRHCIGPNISFMGQLLQYEEKLVSKKTSGQTVTLTMKYVAGQDSPTKHCLHVQ